MNSSEQLELGPREPIPPCKGCRRGNKIKKQCENCVQRVFPLITPMTGDGVSEKKEK